MIKVINKKTGVIKEVTQEVASMYLNTNEWEIFKEKIKEKPIFTKIKEDKYASRII